MILWTSYHKYRLVAVAMKTICQTNTDLSAGFTNVEGSNFHGSVIVDVYNTPEESNTSPKYTHEVANNNTNEVSSLCEANIVSHGEHATQNEKGDIKKVLVHPSLLLQIRLTLFLWI